MTERATTPLLQLLRPDGTLAVSIPLASAKEVVYAYRSMMLARILNEKLIALQRQGRMGTYVSSSGQEASQVGNVLALNERDWVFPMYRNLGIVIQKGVPPDDLLNSYLEKWKISRSDGIFQTHLAGEKRGYFHLPRPWQVTSRLQSDFLWLPLFATMILCALHPSAMARHL